MLEILAEWTNSRCRN